MKKNQVDRSVTRSIKQSLELREEISTDFVADEIYRATNFDFEALKEEHCKQAARMLLATSKDSEGDRVWFATREKDKPSKYINIKTCKDKKVVDAIMASLKSQQRQFDKNIRTAEARSKYLKNQYSMLGLNNEILDEPKTMLELGAV